MHESFAPALESMKEFFARLEANPPGNVLPKEPEYPAAKDARTGAAGQNEKTQLKEGAALFCEASTTHCCSVNTV